MSEVRFYHLLTQEQAVPVILTKALSGGRRVVVRLADEDSMRHFDDVFWTCNPESFMPHGTSHDKHPEKQPVYLTTEAENPNNADMLVLCNFQTVPENIDQFSLCCDFLNGQNDLSVQAGRARWKEYKQAGHTVTYWQQTETGGWEQKA